MYTFLLRRFILALTTFALLTNCNSLNLKNKEDNLNYVDPFIGTGFHGHTFPGPTLPFGMVQLSPDTHLKGWDSSSGYHYQDSLIYAFSHTHLSGTGIGDLGDVALLPYSTRKDFIPVGKFEKISESASPGYYKVTLNEDEIDVELTTTTRVGMHRYTYSNPDKRRLMLNLAHILQSDWGGAVVHNQFEVVDSQTVQGIRHTTGWAEVHQVAYRIEFSESFAQIETVIDSLPSNLTSFEAVNAQVHFKFVETDNPLLVKVAISPVNPEGAAKNMEAELPGWNFDEIQERATQTWRKALQLIEIESQDISVKSNFYTALYHTMMAPITWQDIDGKYRGMNQDIIQAPHGFTNYTVFSLWDTFRAFHPLMTIIHPVLAEEWCKVLVQKFREGGILPKWPLVSNYTGTMVGYPAISVLADAAAKGLAPDSLSSWLKAAVISSGWNQELANQFVGTRKERVMDEYSYFKETYGLIPSDSISKSVSYGLEMAYFDWCVAQLAILEGDKDISRQYLEKSKAYKKYFDAETGFMRGKNLDGSWRTPFNPRFSDHDQGDYVEGNAWQWSFSTQHAIEDMIKLYGGKEQYEAMLDTLFTTSSVVEGKNASGDITGLIGQYAHGNEPSHHIAYLYNWTNAPHKTQERLDQIMQEFYLPTPEGIIGNEDCGQMSAWYVMSALGFYQVCPGDPSYTLGRPMIDRAVLNLPGGQFKIIAHNNSAENKYVHKVYLNGSTLVSPFISHQQIIQGGQLEFYMSKNIN